MNKPRTLKRLLAAGLALFIAWQAQGRLADPLSNDGWILYGIAIVLFVAALGRVHMEVLRARGGQFTEGRTFALRMTGRVSSQAESPGHRQVVLLCLAVLIGLGSFMLFANSSSQPAAWWFHIAALVAFLAAVMSGSPRAKDDRRVAAGNGPAGGSSLRLVRYLPLAAVVALAAFARLWQIDQFPVGTWYDEAFNGNGAVQMLQNSGFRPVFMEGDTLPAHFAYLLALSFRLFGVSTISMRFVTAAFGIATAAVGYLLFRRWFGERIGFATGVLFAVMRYDLTFSRIALHGVTTPFFELAALYWLDRVLERRRVVDVGWLAVTLGIGLAFYTPFRLFPIALAVFLAAHVTGSLRRPSSHQVPPQGNVIRGLSAWRLGAAHSGPGGSTELLRAWAPYVVVFVIGLFVATTPISEFVLQNGEAFFARTNTVSIFEQRDEPDLGKALWSNFSKHMLMFNVLGDRNGRHNLPNEPMLDPVMGALAVLGFALALWRWRDPANGLMLLVFFTMNLGGILSVDFEAPQSLRSIGVIPALVYFAVLPLAAIGIELTHVLRPASSLAHDAAASGYDPAVQTRRGLAAGGQSLFNLGLIAVLAAAAYGNFDTFFNRQKNSPEVWSAHSVAETLVAQQMNRLAPDYDLVVTALFANHPTLRFIAPNVTNYQQWTVNDRLPLVREPGRSVAMLLDPLLASTVDASRRYYPTAAYREFTPPTGGSPAAYQLLLGDRELRSVAGIEASYFEGFGGTGALVKTEALTTLNIDWTKSVPVNGDFTAEFRGTLDILDYGSYELQMDGAPEAEILLDENPVGSAALVLAKGLHALRVRVAGGARRVALMWRPPATTGRWQLVPATALFRPPVTNSGLLGAYYPSSDWSGPPAFTQVDPEISLYFHNIALPRPYSIQWSGKIYAPVAGAYRFATESIDESQVALNSQIVVTNRGSTTAEGLAQLPQGWNDIVVRFADHTAHTHIYLSWTPPNGTRETVPSRYLSPPMGKYPSAAEIAALPKPLPLPNVPGGTPGAATSARPTPVPSGQFNLVWQLSIGEAGNGPLQFNEPRGVAAAANGGVFVADTANRRVQAVDASGHFRFAIEGGEERFVEPFDLVVAANDDLIVLDSDQGWLYRFDADGNSLGRIGGPPAQFYHPRGLSIDAQDNLYVADTGGSRIVKLALDGRRLQVYGSRGNGPGQFIEPTSGALDLSGYLYATDVPNHRILSFSSDGKFILEFPIPPAGAFNGPRIAFAPDQTLLVTEPERQTLGRYARDGTLLGEWGELGQKSGQFRLPTGITTSGTTVWIADTGNNRIQEWMVETAP
jgi:4-amino-4-deoxy-L-arabinose transferase-like glycosyltransferase/sugar lactone lactonase YvrE